MIKVKKPVIPAELHTADDFLPLAEEAKSEEIDITSLHIKDSYLSEEDLSMLSCTGMIFENCTFHHCKMEKATFTDVIFKACDLSNTDFSDGYFKCCEFRSCKGMGANLFRCTFHHISFADCIFRYASFDNSKLNFISIEESDFCNASLAECKLNSIGVDRVQFSNAIFFKTPLKGIDLSQCQIDGIVLSDNNPELQGAIVDALQAVDLARLLGVTIK